MKQPKRITKLFKWVLRGGLIGLPLAFSSTLAKLFKWVLRGGLIGLPLAFSSTLALSQRLTWVGAVLLWFYTGRVMKQRETQDDQTPR
jgi:hypothetical protein